MKLAILFLLYNDTMQEKQTSLRKIVKQATDQDPSRCQGCQDCIVPIEQLDISLGSMVQLILFNDEEVLGSKTLWSDDVLSHAEKACHRGLNLKAIMLALREEFRRRNQPGGHGFSQQE